MQVAHTVVVDGDESHLAQPFTLHTIVHNIAQAIECLALCQLFFGFFDGCGHSEAETAAVVYFYLHILLGTYGAHGTYWAYRLLKYSSSKSPAATKLVF